MRTGAPRGAEHRAARRDRGLLAIRMKEEPAAREDELQLAATMPVRRDGRARRDLDHTTIEISTVDSVVYHEIDARPWERVRPTAP